MALFGIGKTKSYLGIDIGAAGVKLVEFHSDNGRAKLHTYAWSERLPGAAGTSLLDDPSGTAATIKAMMKKAKTTAQKTVTGLPISAVFSSVISVPRMSDKEQKGAIEVQARKLISMPLEELILDTKVITSQEALKVKGPSAAKNLQVLLTAAPKPLVSKYLRVFRDAGLELSSLETEAFALIRSLVGKDKSTLMIIDIGSLRTSVLVVVGGIPYLSRSIDVGGAKFTQAAAASLGVPEDQAEAMKNDFQAISGLAPSSIPAAFEPIANLIVTEVSFSLKLFAGLGAENGQIKEDAAKIVDKVILTGGGSLLPNLDAYLAQKLNLRVFRGDPWARILYPDPVRPLLDQIGPRFSVAVGLASREFDQ
jgi:type IV pilus assembly protein PilM